MIKTFACSFALISFLSGSSVTAADAKTPSEIIRAVRILQDQIVAGDVNAQIALPKLLNQLGDRMLEFKYELWSEPKNFNSLVGYLLSGGQPKVGRKILANALLPEDEKKLLRGVLAYVSGNELEAKKNLQDYDPRTFSPALGSHIALVQASLNVQENPGAAMKLLDLARLLSPGTLIEEAALRREVFLADDTGNLESFVSLADQYLRRFKTSLYFENFRIRFTKSISRFAQRNNALDFAKLVRVINLLPPQEQLSIYLSIAQTSIINGKATSGRLAAQQAGNLAKFESIEAARAKFYSTIVAALQNDYEKSFPELENLHDLPLPKSDVELKETLIAMLRQSHKTPENWAVLNFPEPSISNHGTDRNVSESASQLIDQVHEKLNETDNFVRDVSP